MLEVSTSLANLKGTVNLSKIMGISARGSSGLEKCTEKDMLHMKIKDIMKETLKMDSFRVKVSTKRTLTRIKGSFRMELSMETGSSKTSSESISSKASSKTVSEDRGL